MEVHKLKSFEIKFHNKSFDSCIDLLDINNKISEEINTCTSCLLHLNSKNKVILKGSLKPRILFIGEAPGYNEDKTGQPFSGVSGKKLE